MRTPLLRRIVVGFLLLSWFLAACAGPAPRPTPASATSTLAKADPSPTPVHSTTPVPTPGLGVSADALRGTSLTFWYALDEPAGQTLEKLIVQFNAINPWGILVRPRGFLTSSDLLDAIQPLSSASPPPDLVTLLPLQLRAFQSTSELLLDLSPYVKDAEWGLKSGEEADFLTPFWQAGLDGQVRLGVPWLLDGGVLYYNQTWARELGFDSPPATPGEFEQQVCAAAKANAVAPELERRGTGGWIAASDWLTASSWVTAFGGNLRPSASGEYRLNTPEVVDAFAYLKRLFDQGCAWLARNPSPYDYFAHRMALMYAGSLEEIPAQARAMKLADSADEWTIVPFPAQNGAPLLIADGLSFAVIRSNPERQLAAWLLVRWLLDPSRLAEQARAAGVIPARNSSLQMLESDAAMPSQWRAVAARFDQAEATPEEVSWRTARNVLEDAVRQLFEANTRAEQVPDIVQQLDQMVREVLDKGS